MSDLIKREDAIDEIRKSIIPHDIACTHYSSLCINAVRRVPSADIPQDDEFKNFDRESLLFMIDVQKERIGELLADRPQGEWIDAEIPLESGGSMPIQACNLCKTFYPLAYTGGGHRFCPNCGARMKGADDEEISKR